MYNDMRAYQRLVLEMKIKETWKLLEDLDRQLSELDNPTGEVKSIGMSNFIENFRHQAMSNPNAI